VRGVARVRWQARRPQRLTDLANPVIRRARPGDARGPATSPAIELDTGMTGLGAYRSAKQWAEDIRSKKVSSVEALRLHLDRVEKFNQEVNAIVVFDLDRAHSKAAAADAAIARGETWGPLHGYR
jgi:Amidase